MVSQGSSSVNEVTGTMIAGDEAAITQSHPTGEHVSLPAGSGGCLAQQESSLFTGSLSCMGSSQHAE
jgi:hypothetical protein